MNKLGNWLIDRTSTKNRKQRNKVTHSPETPKTQKLALAKTNTELQNPGLTSCYDIRPENRESIVESECLTVESGINNAVKISSIHQLVDVRVTLRR